MALEKETINQVRKAILAKIKAGDVSDSIDIVAGQDFANELEFMDAMLCELKASTVARINALQVEFGKNKIITDARLDYIAGKSLIRWVNELRKGKSAINGKIDSFLEKATATKEQANNKSFKALIATALFIKHLDMTFNELRKALKAGKHEKDVLSKSQLLPSLNNWSSLKDKQMEPRDENKNTWKELAVWFEGLYKHFDSFEENQSPFTALRHRNDESQVAAASASESTNFYDVFKAISTFIGCCYVGPKDTVSDEYQAEDEATQSNEASSSTATNATPNTSGRMTVEPDKKDTPEQKAAPDQITSLDASPDAVDVLSEDYLTANSGSSGTDSETELDECEYNTDDVNAQLAADRVDLAKRYEGFGYSINPEALEERVDLFGELKGKCENYIKGQRFYHTVYGPAHTDIAKQIKKLDPCAANFLDSLRAHKSTLQERGSNTFINTVESYIGKFEELEASLSAIYAPDTASQTSPNLRRRKHG